MNPNTATNEELRDWLATKLHGFVKTGFVGFHPIPNTIDAAVDSIPAAVEKWLRMPNHYDLAGYIRERQEQWAADRAACRSEEKNQ